MNKNTHLHHEQPPQEAVQSLKDQRRLEIPLPDLLVLLEVSAEMLPSVLKALLEAAQCVHGHVQLPLTFLRLTSQEALRAEVIRGLERKQIGDAEHTRVQGTLQFLPIPPNSEWNNWSSGTFQKQPLGDLLALSSVQQVDWDLDSSHTVWDWVRDGQVPEQRNHHELRWGQLGLGDVFFPGCSLVTNIVK